ncbi:GerAB/ArcD/ProY family transporter [Jeotgalibacillus aurantiacus]|uniref:GerAB/ArcD/ProY family transporter n=1 Tax=Jeotgalibacillus aurantiacus TaxID=2763266 RepID=UPI001D09E863|nr:GerAB/ArcD/ProY family transporter [Jeotgalibacillus aurantiacus]
MNEKNEISGWQLFFLIVQTQIGVGALSMPADISIESGHDAWISLVIAGVLMQILILFYFWMMTTAGDMSYFEITKKAFGRIVGKCLIALYSIYFIYVVIVSNISFIKVISEWIYMDTPRWVLMILFLLPAVYLVRGHVSTIARFSMLVSFFLPILVFILLFVYTQPEFLYLLPVGGEGIENILKGLKPALFALLGFEAFLYFSSYVKKDRKKELKKATYATLFVFIFYLFLIITTQVFFYVDEIKIIPYPVLYIMKALSFVIVDRIDLLFLTFWMVIAATSLMNYLFISSQAVRNVFLLKDHANAVVIIALLVLFISSIPKTKADIKEWTDVLLYLSVVFTIFLPLITFILFRLRRRIEK